MFRQPSPSRIRRRAPHSVRRAPDAGLDDILRHGVDGEYPFYPEDRFRREASRHPEIRLTESVSGPAAAEAEYLQESELQDLVDALGLRPMDRMILEMRLAGYTIPEIAAMGGLKKWRVDQAIARVRRRAEAVRRSGQLPDRHAGWQDVYAAETRRRGCRRQGTEEG